MAKNEIAFPCFSYDTEGIEKDTSGKLISLAGGMNTRRERMTTDIWEYGKDLADAHDLLAEYKSGCWGRWVEGECGISRQTAQNYLQVYHQFSNCQMVRQIEPVAAYILSKPDTPTGCLTKAVKLGEQGHRITAAVARALIAAKQKPKDAPGGTEKPKKKPAPKPQVVDETPVKFEDEPPEGAVQGDPCPSCSCVWWEEDEEGKTCWKCKQPWGEPGERFEHTERDLRLKQLRRLLEEAVNLADDIGRTWAWEKEETVEAIRQLHILITP